MPKFYVTTPIYYVNDNPHIGHAYTTIAADVLARYHRLLGDSVFFLTGTDEHGAKVAQSAEKQGLDPLEFCNRKSASFQMAWDSLNITNDDFIRTTEERHKKAVHDLWQKLYDEGFVYKGKYEGLYCVGCEAYKTENELVDGKCPLHNAPPQPLIEENWFFKLSAFNDRLKKVIESDTLKIRPISRKNEVLGFLKEGLQDIAMSREHLKWGIKLPFDDTQVAYVWVEALINYISGAGYPDNWPGFWPADIQLVGKDILKFHTTLWPAMLLGANLELPKQVFVHGFFTINGQKMSKSLGNAIDPVALSQNYGVDPIRYFLLSEFSFGQDGDFSMDRFKERFNTDLANGLGNLVNRVLSMYEKYNPAFSGAGQPKEIIELVEKAWEQYQNSLIDLQFNDALNAVWRLLGFGDGYIDENKPWVLAKENKEKLSEVLYNLLEIIRHAAWMLQPFMPETSDKILRQLGVWEEKEKPLEEIREWGRLPEKAEIKKGAPLFPRLEI